jgi:CheY-like chemotaxis protein
MMAGEDLPRLASPELLQRATVARRGGATRVPLYHRTGSVVLLDDDPDFVDMLSGVLPRGWQVRKFLSPESCLNHLQQQPPQWEADFWAQQEIVEQARTGVSLLALLLRYWATTPARHTLTKVLVLDYLMPGRDGLDTLRDLVDWPGHRVLLTGAFDEWLAVDAFNEGLIDHFVQKQQPDLHNALVGMIEGLLARPNPRHHQIWSATLESEQMQLLQRADVARDLNAFLSASFVEWVVIGKPFGVLGLDGKGHAYWLQLESLAQLDELAEHALEAGAMRDDGAAIRAGNKLANVAMRQSLGMGGTDVLPALRIGDQPLLAGALTRIDIHGAAAALNRHWLSAAAPGNQSAY